MKAKLFLVALATLSLVSLSRASDVSPSEAKVSGLINAPFQRETIISAPKTGIGNGLSLNADPKLPATADVLAGSGYPLMGKNGRLTPDFFSQIEGQVSLRRVALGIGQGPVFEWKPESGYASRNARISSATLTKVPEPATLALFFTGVGLLLLFRRRRRRLV